MSFYLFLPSNVSPKYFPNNRISSFQVKLPKRIILDADQFEVALTELSYVHSMMTYFNNNDRYVWNVTTPEVGYKTSDCLLLPNINYSKIETLISELRKLIPPENATVSFSRKLNRVIIIVHQNELWLTRAVGLNLGFSATTFVSEPSGQFLFKPGEYTASKSPMTHGGMCHIFVYSDIVKPQIVGDTMAPLLRIVNVTGEEDDVVTQTFRPYYFPINKQEFDTIEILLCNEFGEEIHFEKGESIVTLHFKKRK